MFHVKQAVRRLVPGDEEKAEAFLRAHADTSLLLLANFRAAGFTYAGRPNEAEYVAIDRDGAIAGIAAHAWNGMVLLQAPHDAAALAKGVIQMSGRRVAGLLGPWEQALAARAALGLAGAATVIDGCDILFGLMLCELVAPPSLCDAAWVVRPPEPREHDRLVEWRVAYRVEDLGEADSGGLRRQSAEDIEELDRRQAHFVLTVDGALVAYCAFPASLPEMVQLGGVWTPPDLRRRGYGRAVVAGALLRARQAGATRAVLFTAAENVAAQRVYRAVGFAPIGHYGIIILK